MKSRDKKDEQDSFARRINTDSKMRHRCWRACSSEGSPCFTLQGLGALLSSHKKAIQPVIALITAHQRPRLKNTCGSLDIASARTGCSPDQRRARVLGGIVPTLRRRDLGLLFPQLSSGRERLWVTWLRRP
jgi:hypothetical protein